MANDTQGPSIATPMHVCALLNLIISAKIYACSGDMYVIRTAYCGDLDFEVNSKADPSIDQSSSVRDKNGKAMLHHRCNAVDETAA